MLIWYKIGLELLMYTKGRFGACIHSIFALILGFLAAVISAC